MAEQREHLTGLRVRADFDSALVAHVSQANAEHPVGLIMADVDHFKRINDSKGHPAGDAVLKEVARRFNQVVLGKGSAYRYGGEEFAAILPNHNIDEALAVNRAGLVGGPIP